MKLNKEKYRILQELVDQEFNRNKYD